MSALSWTRRSTWSLAAGVKSQGFPIGSFKVGQALKLRGCKFQSNRETVEGEQHPGRDAQS